MDKDVKIVLLLTGGVLLYVYLNKQGYFKKEAPPMPPPPPLPPQEMSAGIGHSSPCTIDEEDIGTPNGIKCVPKTVFSGNKQFLVNQDFSVYVSNPNYRGERTTYFQSGDIISGGYMTYYKYNYDTQEFEYVTDLITTPNGKLPMVFDTDNSGLAIGEVIIDIPQDAVSEVGGVRPTAFSFAGNSGTFFNPQDSKSSILYTSQTDNR